MQYENVINIYTDGSSCPKPRRGIGFKIIYVNEIGEEEELPLVKFAGYKDATNNQMELMACIKALKEISKRKDILCKVDKILIYTDSKYIVNNYKNAMFQWPRSHWYKAEGSPVLNANLWKELISNIKKVGKKVDFVWVKGHSMNKHNKEVDRMAKDSAQIPINNPISNVEVRRKQSTNSVDRGSVKMQGQRIKIRVITCEYLKVQKIYKYKYEVISKTISYFNKVDIIFSNEVLKTGHIYLVSFNKNNNYPQLSKLIKEIPFENK
jgi:ribonuclease HI